MKHIDEQKELLDKVLSMLEQHFGSTCEVVLHDLTKDYDHTIVDIRNGHITNRKIGDCGSNLGLEVLRGNIVNGDRYNYITHTMDAKILRSSSLYIRNEGQVIGALCINTDITETVRYESYLHQMNNYSFENGETTEKEVFANNVKQLLEHFLVEAVALVGKEVDQTNREDKMQILRYLDDKGAFLITKSSERVCEFLKISRYTLYNYLETLREENGRANGEKKE